MSSLPRTPIVCDYNGVVWPTETICKGISWKPVLDASGRTVVYLESRIQLYAIFATANQNAGLPTDSTLTNLRKRLTAPAGRLYLQYLGCGDIIINFPGSPQDVSFGPIPEVLSWRGIGANQAAEVEWAVTFRVAECDGIKGYTFPYFLEFNFETRTSIDQSGYSTRVMSGFFQIPMTRTNTPAPVAGTNTGAITSSRLQHTADELYDKVLPVLLPGFRRTYGPRVLDYAKTKITFEAIDTECGPNYLPPGVIDAHVEHAVESMGQVAYGANWSGSFSGTVEIARDRSASEAFLFVNDLVEARLNIVKKQKYNEYDDQGKIIVRDQNNPAQQAVIINRFALREIDIYAKQVTSFFVGYQFLCALPDIVKGSGLWTEVPNSSWSAWSASLNNTGFHERGNAKLRTLPTDDVIVDLCQSVTEPPTPEDQPTLPPPTRGPATSKGPPFRNEQPKSHSSWLMFTNRIYYEFDDEAIEIKPLPFVVPKPQPPDNDKLDNLSYFVVPGDPSGSQSGGVKMPVKAALPDAAAYANAVGAVAGGLGSAVTALANSGAGAANAGANAGVVQIRNRPSFRAILEGAALRCGFPIQIPKLISVGGLPAIPANRRGVDYVSHEVVASWFGVPVYGARWHITYLVPGVPNQDLPVPGNPIYGS